MASKCLGGNNPLPYHVSAGQSSREQPTVRHSAPGDKPCPEHASPENEALWEAAMRRGDWAAAWRVSDAVLRARDPARRDDPRLPYHERWVWDGRDLAGQRVLVRCYHGLGDTLQFVRLLALLRPRVAALALEVQPEILPLLRRLPGPDRMIPFRLDAPAPAECDVELMELPHALRLEPASLPAVVPYVHAEPERVAAMRHRLGPGIKVGVCWQAGDWDPERSVPLAALAPILALPGVTPVSLQRGKAASEALAGYAPAFANPHDRSLEILETAALIGALDLVITVDTMVAHLAGALGCATWVLLRAAADWRWMAGRTDSPWYPTMRLYRQDRPGEWRGVLDRLAADLADFVSRSAD